MAFYTCSWCKERECQGKYYFITWQRKKERRETAFILRSSASNFMNVPQCSCVPLSAASRAAFDMMTIKETIKWDYSGWNRNVKSRGFLFLFQIKICTKESRQPFHVEPQFPNIVSIFCIECSNRMTKSHKISRISSRFLHDQSI